VVRGQRAPEQDGNDQGEDDHFLEGAGVERRIGFEQADQDGAQGSQRVGREAADDGPDEALEADQETGVVVDRGDRRDQDAGEGADGGSQRKAQLAGEDGGNAHQAGAGAVHRGGAQGLAVDGPFKEEIEADDEQGRGDDDQDGLPLQRRTGQFEADVGEGRRAPSLGTEEEQAEADQRQVHGDRDNEQDEDRCAGQRLEGNPVDHRAERHDEQHGEDDLGPQRQLAGRHGEQPGSGDQRYADVGDEQGRQLGVAPFAHQPVAVEQRDGGTQAEQQPDRAGHFAGLQRGQGQRPEGDEFALRNEDDACDGEDENQREGEQRVNGAVGDAVLAEKEKNLEVHVTLGR